MNITPEEKTKRESEAIEAIRDYFKNDVSFSDMLQSIAEGQADLIALLEEKNDGRERNTYLLSLYLTDMIKLIKPFVVNEGLC